MGVRLTGISTPILGLNWEFTDPKVPVLPATIIPGQKIKVFISSICYDNDKFDRVRFELKRLIESTKLADVYTFEGKGAASITAQEHYTFALEDSDICIFLIDNELGITPGVQVEIDTVTRNNMKALYYFCDETRKEKTPFEESIMGASFAKSKTIHKFDDLILNGAQDLIDDIISTYHHYCKGRFVSKKQETSDFQYLELVGTEKYHIPTIPKAVLKNIDRSSGYMSDFLLSRVQIHRNESLKTGPMDEWCTQFLPVLFERKSIKQFNTGMFLDDLKQLQEPEHFSIVQVRWQAIQAYFMGDVAKCVDYVEQALKLAKDANQPQWVIKDILIDLRNESMVLGTINNHLKVPDAQKELTDSEEELYYPILDRIHTTLHEKYIEGLYKQKTESPYSVTLGSNIHEMGALLASSCIVAMYNGSLTHILLLFDKIRDCLFYLSSRYSDWNFRRDLLKMVIYGGSAKEIKGIQDSYPEIINMLSVQDANDIMSFCENQPIPYKRLNSQLLAFGSVGYFLDDTSFQKYESMLIDEIKTWLNAEVFVAAAGQNTFTALTGVAYRISQDTLCDICCMFIDRHYSRWYSNMFKFIAEKIRLDEMQHDSAVKLISHIISILDNEADRRLISNSPTFLSILRKQSIELTTALDEKIAQCLPAYYDGFYKLNTSEDTLTDHPKFIQEYVELILKDNASQGKNGVYAGRGIRLHETIRLILLAEDMQYEASIMDSVISASAETIVKSQEDISTKLDAVALLICIAFKYPEDYKRNSDVYKDIYNSREDIKVSELALVSSNIDSISLQIALCLLFAAVQKDVSSDILELLPYIKDDIATTISVASMIIKYLDSTPKATFSDDMETIVLLHAMQWLQSEHSDIRWYATRILLALLRKPNHRTVINRQLVKLVSNESVYIKNLILRSISNTPGISNDTREYIISKCSMDSNYVVRKVCQEIQSIANK